MNRSSALALIVSAVLVSSAALAQEPAVASGGAPGSITDTSHHTRPMELSLMAEFDYWALAGVGVTADFNIPVVPDGFIPGVNDDFSIEPGLSADFGGYLGYSYVNITPHAVAMWRFHFSEAFSAYGALGLGVGFYPGCTPGFCPNVYIQPIFDVGVFYYFNPHIGIRGEVGSGGIRGGIVFAF